MKRLSLLLSMFVLFVLPAFASTPLGYVTVSASNVQDSAGILLANGTISFTPVNNSGAPISYRVNGKGQAITTPVSTLVTNGAFSIQLADTAQTAPDNVCYAVTIWNKTTGKQILGTGYGCVQPAGSGVAVTSSNAWCTAATPTVGGICNFDNYTPNLAALVTVQTGPVSPAPNIASGSATGLVNRQSPTVTVTGTNPNYTLNVGIPAGPSVPVGAPQGAYSSTTTYTNGQVVTFNGQSYISLAPSNLGNEPDTSPTLWGPLTSLSNLPAAFASQSAAGPEPGTFSTVSAKGNVAGQSIGNIFQASAFPGATAAEKITVCLAAAGNFGTCDATGLTGIIPADVMVQVGTPCSSSTGTFQTLLMNPAASYEPSTHATSLFQVNCNGRLINAHIVIPSSLSYTGKAVSVIDTITNNTLNAFSVDGLNIDGQNYSAGGYGLYIAPPAGSFIQLTTFHNIKINGLANSVYVFTTGTSGTYFNGNNFSDLVINGNGNLLTLDNASGSLQISGNTFSNIQTDGLGCAVSFQGVKVDTNIFSPIKIFDTTTPICNTATGVFGNIFIGSFDTAPSDPSTGNNIYPFQDVYLLGASPWSTLNLQGVNVSGPDTWTNAINAASSGFNGLGLSIGEADYDQNVFTGGMYSHVFRAANSTKTGRNTLGGFSPTGIWYAGALAGTAGTSGSTATGYTVGSAPVAGSGATAGCAPGYVCDELSGTVQFVTGTGVSVNGTALTINLGTTRTHNANCPVTVINASLGAPDSTSFLVTTSNTAITLASTRAITSSNTWDITYFCGGG
jgi:hypothetical protein